MPSTATSSRYQAGIRIPRRIRESGIALRKLIRLRSVAAEMLSGTRRGRIRRPQLMLTAPAMAPVTDFKSALESGGSLLRPTWLRALPAAVAQQLNAAPTTI